MANNFAVLFPSYYTQMGFTGSAPAVPFFYGPKYLTQQTAPNQVVCVVGDEPFTGAEVHDVQLPNPRARELSRMWTRIHFYCWGAPSTISGWTAGLTVAAAGDIIPATQNGYWYQSTAGGVTGGTEPTWPTTIGATVADGSVTWICIGTVDSFRIYDTDMTDLIRIVVAAAAHYTAVGSYRPVKGTWYDRTDQLVMSGLTNRVSFDFLIPVPDLGSSIAQINTATITGTVT
jgi:hypothetical protein